MPRFLGVPLSLLAFHCQPLGATTIRTIPSGIVGSCTRAGILSIDTRNASHMAAQVGLASPEASGRSRSITVMPYGWAPYCITVGRAGGFIPGYGGIGCGSGDCHFVLASHDDTCIAKEHASASSCGYHHIPTGTLGTSFRRSKKSLSSIERGALNFANSNRANAAAFPASSALALASAVRASYSANCLSPASLANRPKWTSPQTPPTMSAIANSATPVSHGSLWNISAAINSIASPPIKTYAATCARSLLTSYAPLSAMLAYFLPVGPRGRRRSSKHSRIQEASEASVSKGGNTQGARATLRDAALWAAPQGEGRALDFAKIASTWMSAQSTSGNGGWPWNARNRSVPPSMIAWAPRAMSARPAV